MILKMHSIIYEYFFSNTRKRFLKEIASEILLNGALIRTYLIRFQYYSFIRDIIDAKLYKPEQIKEKEKIPKYTGTVKFENKAL